MLSNEVNYGECARGAGLRLILGTFALFLLMAAFCFLVILSTMAFFFVASSDGDGFSSGSDLTLVDDGGGLESSDMIVLADYPQD